VPIHNYLIPALEEVLNWDLSDEACCRAASDQAGLMAGAAADQGNWSSED
jgi:hypothetical protein